MPSAAGLAGPLADALEGGQRLPVAVGGLLVAAPPFVDGAEVGQRDGLAPAVADRDRGGQRLLVVVGRLLVAGPAAS